MLRICSNFSQIKPLNFLHNFQHLLNYATTSISTSIDASTTQSFTNYLVNSLGFSNQQALSISNRANNFKLSPNSQVVVDFFEKQGFDDTQIRKIVSSYPRILCSKVDKTLIPKFKLFQDLGFSGSDLVRVVSLNPKILVHKLTPVIADLRIILGSDENLVQFFLKSNRYTTSTSLKNLVSNVALLENDYGVCIELIRHNILQKQVFFMRNTNFFKKVVIRVAEELRIRPDSGMFLNGIFLLCCYSDESIESKRQLFRKFGWSDYHVCELIRRSPISFFPSEGNIGKKLAFFMNELGLDAEFLASHSALFTYSLEKRVLPRYRVLQVLEENGLLEYKFYTAVIKSEGRFLEMFVEPFKDVVPGIHELYQSSKDCSVFGSLST
ncbi:hypothetical protein RND81_01G024600 [Saponaria officinalis]|uniref:Uncharacterized protein n=1 Tax=Saponaria officinalis TaxID=3572 RepID=A0AAW1NFQ5_SAPOF